MKEFLIVNNDIINIRNIVRIGIDTYTKDGRYCINLINRDVEKITEDQFEKIKTYLNPLMFNEEKIG